MWHRKKPFGASGPNHLVPAYVSAPAKQSMLGTSSKEKGTESSKVRLQSAADAQQCKQDSTVLIRYSGLSGEWRMICGRGFAASGGGHLDRGLQVAHLSSRSSMGLLGHQTRPWHTVGGRVCDTGRRYLEPQLAHGPACRPVCHAAGAPPPGWPLSPD